MDILTAHEVRELDRHTIKDCGVSEKRLMARAGRAVFDVVRARLRKVRGRRIALFCGPGNNGGDGLVVKNLLEKAGARVIVYSPLKTAFESIRNDFQKRARPDLFVDALFGTGLSRPVTGAIKKFIRFINRQKIPCVAIDIPSGLNADTGEVMGEAVICADTVTFEYPKTGLYLGKSADYTGRIHVKKIGLRTDRFRASHHLITKSCLSPLSRERKADTHKGSYGHVFVVAGSVGKIGAGVMAAHSALRAGAGLATLILPQGAYLRIDPKALEIMYEPVGSSGQTAFRRKDVGAVVKILSRATVVALGPGIGQAKETIAFVHQLLLHYQGPLIIDADGLNALAKKPDILRRRRGWTLITPHPAEMGRLIGKTTAYVQRHRLEVARDFARRFGVHVLLKGYHSLVALPDGEIWINPTGGAYMSNAGQGDVLTGIYAGLKAQFPDHPEVPLMGCYLHGLIGDRLHAQGRRVVLATDIADALPCRTP